jgi:hypothetical protein
MNRRTFLNRAARLVAAIAVLGVSLTLTGCSALTDLLNWIPVGLQAISSILSLLSGAGVVVGPAISTIIGLIQVGLADLRLAIVEYQSTVPPPAGALAKIDTFLADLVSNIGNVLQQLPTGPASIITLVVGLFELVLSTIEGFLMQIPAAAAGALPKTDAVFKRGMTVNGVAVSIGPRKNLTRRAFIRDYNRLVDAGGQPGAALPESLAQHL